MGRTQRKRKQRKEVLTTEEGDYLGGLFKYLHSFGWNNETSLTVRNFSITGRGACSKNHKLTAGDEIIRLPIESLITIETLENDDTFRSYFNVQKFDKERRISFQALLALYILHQKHQVENSAMHAYINSLPKEFSVPYFCTIKELQSLPDIILERTVAQNRIIKENYSNICQVIDTSNLFEEQLPLNKFKWAYFVVNTRSVYMNNRQLRSHKTIKSTQGFFKSLLNDETNLALAPFLDLLNHSDKVSISADLLPHSAATKRLDYVLTLQNAPSLPIQPYTQIFISYGNLTNVKLLTEYGFVLKENIHDIFEISLQDIENFLKNEPSLKTRIFHRNKFKFIRDHNLHDQMFVHSSDGISHNLRVVLHLLLKEPSYFPNILNQVAFGATTQLDDMKEEVIQLITFKINEYKIFLGSLQALESLTNSGLMAVSYITESLRYLESCLDIL